MIYIFLLFFSTLTYAGLPESLDSLEECGLLIEVHMINEDIKYLEELEEYFNNVQAERLTPETSKDDVIVRSSNDKSER